MEKVLETLELMFFSLPISPEIQRKYNKLKEIHYTAAGLPFTPITKSNESFTKSEKGEMSMHVDRENICSSLVEGFTNLFNSMVSYIIDKINNLTELCKSPSKFPYS